MMRKSWIILLTLAVSGAAAAAESQAPSPMAGLVQMLMGLAIVVAVIGALAWAFGRMARTPGGQSPLFRTVASTSLGPRERIVAVEVGDKWLILGVTASNITPLHTLPRGELPASILTPGKFDFQALLSRAMGRDEAR